MRVIAEVQLDVTEADIRREFGNSDSLVDALQKFAGHLDGVVFHRVMEIDFALTKDVEFRFVGAPGFYIVNKMTWREGQGMMHIEFVLLPGYDQVYPQEFDQMIWTVGAFAEDNLLP